MCASLPSKTEKERFRFKGAYNCRHTVIRTSRICNGVEIRTERRICLNLICCHGRATFGEALILFAMFLK